MCGYFQEINFGGKMKINLITLHTSEMLKSINFYQDLLKMKIVQELKPNENMRLVFLKGEGDVLVELIEDKTITILDSVSSNVSMGLFIDSMDEIMELLKDRKIPIKRGPITVPSGNKLLFIEDPNEIEVEFIEGNI
jgi:lactoylglutathione lyase